MASPSALKRHARTRLHVGEFFQELITVLINGEQVTDDTLGDVVNWRFGLGIEVKASDNNHPFRISLRQHKRYVGSRNFPHSRFAYGLCAYRNRERIRAAKRKRNGKRRLPAKRSLLGRIMSRGAQFEHLAENVTDVFLFDLEVMTALASRSRTIDGGAFAGDGRHEQVAILTRQQLKRFNRWSFNRVMREIGLDPRGWKYTAREVCVPTTIGGSVYTSDFLLHTILKRHFSQRFFTENPLLSVA